MEEIGVVKSVKGPFATVAVPKKTMCEQCSIGTCFLTDDGAELEALNDAGAKVGQKVKVVLRSYSYLKSSLIVYGLPALMLILGAVAGMELAGNFGMDPYLGSAIFAFSAFALSFLLVKLWSMGAEKKPEYRPVVTEIIRN